MVAISLYRGNLHRVPDAPRRWLMPTSKIAVKDFKTLLHRRAKALSRLASPPAHATTSNPTPSQPLLPKLEAGSSQLPPEKASDAPREGKNVASSSSRDAEDRGADLHVGLDPAKCSVKRLDVTDFASGSKPEKASEGTDGEGNSQGLREEQHGEPDKPGVETNHKVDVLDDKLKRRKEVEDKLQILNAKKHNLVQVLKQILNAEEELKRRNSMQGMANRPRTPLQVDVSNDSGSLNRLGTPRMGSETNLGGNIEGGEGDDVSNHNMQSRHMLRMSSTSPSSESPLRRIPYIQHNVAPHSSRANLVVSGSPSRFAPIGHPPNLATVSMSGTNYMASSPSPAASGGTSVFRDTRLPSPWN